MDVIERLQQAANRNGLMYDDLDAVDAAVVEIAALRTRAEAAERDLEYWRNTAKEEAEAIEQRDAEIEKLRALLVRYQVANYIPEDCDLYAETRSALEQ